MKHIFPGLVLLSCLLNAPCVYGKVDADRLLQQTEQALQSPDTKRFNYMRFFVVTDKLPQKPGFWENIFSSNTAQNHQRALAIYLFNMYVSTQSYRQSPNILSLNYLGVLDGIVRGPDKFDAQHAIEFYQDNQAQIDGLLQQFRQKTPRHWDAPTKKQILAWLMLLEKQPRKSGKPVYVFPTPNMLTDSLAPALSSQLEEATTTAQRLAQKQVILYDVPDVQLSDYDTKIGNYQTHRKLTYRWVKDECYYMAYTIGRQLIDQVIKHRLAWDTRIYTLTATAKKGEFLSPAKGDRFEMANGQKGLRWRYHTALLVVVQQNNSYVPVVLDPFLGGLTPLPLGKWTTYFNSDTVFSAVPFSRDTSTENAIKTPQKIDGKAVWADGKRYEPAPVLK